MNKPDSSEQQQRRHYVYVIFRPNGVPCYVGKGTGDRWLMHGYAGKAHNKHLYAIIKNAGGNVPKVKIRENLTNAEACEIEIALIAAIGREKDGGPLVNLVAGGEGLCDPSPETRAKMSLVRTGKKQTPQHIANAAATRIGKSPSEETRKKIGASRRGKVHSEEARAKMSEARKGTAPNLSEDALKRIAEFTGSRNKNPEFIAKVAAGRAAMSDEAKALMKQRIAEANSRRCSCIGCRRTIGATVIKRHAAICQSPYA